MAETQTFKNHARYYPLVHFVISPLLFFYLIWQCVRYYQEPNWDRAEMILLAVVLILLSLAARLQALKAQDRVIRLEENLRYREVLPPDLTASALRLPTSKKIALRFSPDEELPELVRKTINGEFKDNKEIKQAIKNWRGDYLRV